MNKVYIADAKNYIETLKSALEWLDIKNSLLSSDGIFIKPNLTFPLFKPGVTTTKEMLHAAIQVFTELHPRVVVGESDGGYNSFDIQDAFKAFDLFNIGQQYGAKVVNLSQEPTVTHSFLTRRGPLSLALPRFLVEENFITVTLPVPKVHCMTGVSLSYKNQWGCIPDMMRLRLHYYFNDIIGPLNRLLKVGLTIVDGTYGLTKNGPVVGGEAVPLGWLVVSSNLGAADRVASHLMGLSLEDFEHYRSIKAETPLPQLDQIETNDSLEPFLSRSPIFYLDRNLWHYITKSTWYSKTWSYIVYESKLSGLLHDIMYTFRPKPEGFRKYQPSEASDKKKSWY